MSQFLDSAAAKVRAQGAKGGGGLKPKTHHFFKAFVWLAGWIAPPLAVVIRFGIGKDFFINIICTICGYFPGHFHNFYCQTIRNNSKASRTPKWAVKYGLVKVKDRRGGRHQWAGRYDERLPDSSRYDYEDGATPDGGSIAEDWDGRGPEPSSRVDRSTTHNGNTRSNPFMPWDNEVEPEEVEGGARTPVGDPLDNEQFYSTGTNTHEGIVSHQTGNKKKKPFGGVRGLLNHRDRYESSPATDGDRFDRMKAARGGRGEPARQEYNDDFEDDFEREINTGVRAAAPAPKPLRSQPTGYAPGKEPPKAATQQKGRFDDFEAEAEDAWMHSSSSKRPTQPAQSSYQPSAAAPAPAPAPVRPQRTGRAEEDDGDLFAHTF